MRDISSYSDAELEAIAGRSPAGAPRSIADYSDAELEAIAGGGQSQPTFAQEIGRQLLRTGRSAGAGLSGIGDIINAPIDAVLGMAGSDFRFGSPSQTIRQGFDTATQGTPYSTAPRDKYERVGDVAAEFVSGAAPFKLAQMASKAPQLAKLAPQTAQELTSLAGAGVGAGVAQEAAPNSFLAQIAGALAGGIGTSVAANVAGNVAQRYAPKLAAPSPQFSEQAIASVAKELKRAGVSIDQLIQTMDDAQARGINLTVPEAAAKLIRTKEGAAFIPQSPMITKQRVLEQSQTRAADVIGKAKTERAGLVVDALKREGQQISEKSKSMADPLYKAIENAPLSNDVLRSFANDDVIKGAISDFTKNKELGYLVKGYAKNSVGYFNEVKKYLDSKANNISDNSTLRGVYRDAAKRITNTIENPSLVQENLFKQLPADKRKVIDIPEYISPVEIDTLVTEANLPISGSKISLVGEIKKMGGLKADPNGEVRNLDNKTIINNKRGIELDDAALSLWEKGYFPELSSRPTINQLIDALNSEVNKGVKRYKDLDYKSKLDVRDAATEELGKIGINPNDYKGKKFSETPEGNYHSYKYYNQNKEMDIPFEQAPQQSAATSVGRQYAQARAAAQPGIVARQQILEPIAGTDSIATMKNQIFGSPDKRAELRRGLGDESYKNISDLMDIVERIQATSKGGSDTGANLAARQEISSSLGDAGSLATGGKTGLFRSAMNAIAEKVNEKNWGELADVYTTRDLTALKTALKGAQPEARANILERFLMSKTVLQPATPAMVQGLGATQPPVVQTPPVTLPNATQPSTMDVVPFEQLMPEAQPNTGTGQPLTPEPFNPSPQSSIEGVIGEAAQIGGANPDLLMAIAETESSLNPNAQAKTSSATGLFQITKDTWRNLVNKYGEQYGVSMRDIRDPRANAIMASLLTRENGAKVSRALGRQITDGEKYIAHFMGAGGAVRLLQADPKKAAYKLFPKEAKANKSIFFAGKTPRTTQEVAQLLASKVEDKMQQRQLQEQPIPQPEPTPQPAPLPEDTMLANIPLGAIQELRKNPDNAAQFDEVFGSGMAQLALR